MVIILKKIKLEKYIIVHIDEKWFTKYYYNDFTDINPNNDEIEKFINKISAKLNHKYNIVITTGSKK